jgi:hypothetical protein
MKALSISMSLIFLFSCVTPKELTKEDSEKIYEHNLSLKQDEIKTKILTFVNENFYSGKAVIQTNDSNLISGNYTFSCGDFDPLGTILVYADATFIIKYYDKNYKIKLILKDMSTQSSDGKSPFAPNMWGNYSEEINENFETFDQALYNYMVTTQDF